MPKNSRHGQSEILTDSDYARIFKHLNNPTHRLFLTIARFTGERWGAILQLKVTDCYKDPSRASALEFITFRACTRKASPDGSKETRQVPVHPLLKSELENYHPPLTEWLFPSARYPTRPVRFQSADLWFRRAVDKAGLGRRGISTHSTRRTLITSLSRSGVSIPVLKKITGHKNDRVLLRYVEVDPQQVTNAIALL
ncbi:tyrosine-type recombinase/integrase [Laspinema olomoucense]|uniref:tyrosine-type recombinase/integrase n=1 Tax=Laspinema olomoucense TaxID=3231600 RepID=UPI0021BAB074|nr:site-specific integrase [Laspinema sp. D3a]MCT7988832.1 site-specific integrase [Laspinema sp. D3a]